MSVMSVPRALLFAGLFGLCVPSPVLCDLRGASQPRNGFEVRQRNAVQFQSTKALYMEPSDFQYQKLQKQRNGGGYDNFLRSNIDNEQAKRNFNTEAGRDMLPFRSFEGAATDASNTVQTKIADVVGGGGAAAAINANPGEPVLYPLRWNNPHASELEVNVWIMKTGAPTPVVVPIKKPTCSGEGHQDNVISFTIPTNFNTLGTTIPGFKGCKATGDCVLQIYAHSVEPRTYVIGVPIIISGTVQPATARDGSGIAPATRDVGLNLGQLPSDICLPSTDPSANIPVAVPRSARLVSDAFNSAYQNSKYSPYSGQQPEAISRNLQAAAIIAMIPANQGELGKELLKQKKPQVANAADKLRKKVKNLVKKYEGLTNKIIGQIGDKMKNTATLGANGVQKLANCFRCAEVGSTTTQRKTTATYVPSFQLPADQVGAAKNIVPAQYSGLISDTGVVQIYVATLNDMKGEFSKAASMGLLYQPAIIKTSMSTMDDPTQFKKVNAQGNRDGGVSAASRAQQTKIASANTVSQNLNLDGAITPLGALSANDDVELPEIYAQSAVDMDDDDDLNGDTKCDNDKTPTEVCGEPTPLFAQSAADDGSGLLIVDETNTATTSSSSSTPISTGIIIAIAAGGGVLLLIIVGAIVKYRINKRTTVVALPRV